MLDPYSTECSRTPKELNKTNSRRIEVSKVKNDPYFKIKVGGDYCSFIMVEDSNAEFRPHTRFSSTASSIHLLKMPDNSIYNVTVDPHGHVTSIYTNGSNVTRIEIPETHMFFKHVVISTPFKNIGML